MQKINKYKKNGLPQLVEVDVHLLELQLNSGRLLHQHSRRGKNNCQNYQTSRRGQNYFHNLCSIKSNLWASCRNTSADSRFCNFIWTSTSLFSISVNLVVSFRSSIWVRLFSRAVIRFLWASVWVSSSSRRVCRAEVLRLIVAKFSSTSWIMN